MRERTQIMTLSERQNWKLNGSAAELYEMYKVPRLFAPLAARLVDGAALRPGERVLDAACGTGVVARMAAERVAPTGNVVGLDLNEAMLAVARAHASAAGAAIEWRQGDCVALPFAARTFDVVLCQQALQFFADRGRALAEMRRVLAAAGRLGLDVFGAPSVYSAALSAALAKYADAQAAASSLAPFVFSDPDALAGMLRNAGFANVGVRTTTISRRVEPTQEWLLQDTAGTPYGASIVAMEPAVRAQLLREIAAQLKNYWSRDCFAVPTEVHFAYAFNEVRS
jgi:ubiquinone/menaquinone biosynthesis C-methylase UbiE